MTRTSSLMILEGEFFDQAFTNTRFNRLQISGSDHFGVDEVLDRAAGQIPNVITRKNHGCRAQDSASGLEVYNWAYRSHVFRRGEIDWAPGILDPMSQRRDMGHPNCLALFRRS